MGSKNHLTAEAKHLLNFSILAYARGYRNISSEFELLYLSISPKMKWGNKFIDKFLFRIGGIPLCGGLMSLKRKLTGRNHTNSKSF